MEKSLIKSTLFLRIILGGILAISAYYAVFSEGIFKTILLCVVLLMLGEWWHCTASGRFSSFKRYQFCGFGIGYILIGSLCILFLWQQEGPWVILWGLAIACGTDTLAFITGKIFKGPLLCPKISPGKTWSGAIGGLIGGAIIGERFYQWKDLSVIKLEGNLLFLSDYSYKVWGICLGLSIVAILGDLLESWAKRRCQVKDSSALIPGHGGVLDRMDSILPVMIGLKLLTLL